MRTFTPYPSFIILAVAIQILVSTAVAAQGSTPFEAASFFRRITGAEDSTNKAKQLRSQALDSMRNNQYGAAERLLSIARPLAELYGETRLVNNILNNLAECYSLTGRSEMALALYHQLLDKVRRSGDSSSIASVLINLGDEYAKTGQKGKAIQTELEAIRIKETSGNLKQLAYYYQKLGELFMGLDAAKWELYTNKALALARNPEQTTWYTTIAIYNSLGGIWSDKGEYGIAGAYYDTMYRLSREADYPTAILTAISERALMLLNQGRFTEALPLALDAHNYALKGDSDYKIVYSSTLLGKIYLRLNQPVKAVSLLEPALYRAKKAGLIPEVLEASQWLSTAYAAAGQWQKAFLSHNEWATLKDSTDGVEIRQVIGDLQTRFETEKKQQLIDRLSEQNSIQKKLTTRLQGLLAASAVSMIMLFVVIWLMRKSGKQSKAIHNQEQQILKLENERLIIDLDYKARELTAATLHLINKNEVLNELKEKLQHADGSESDLRQVVKKIDQNINLDNDWNNFRKHFEQVHPQFFNKLKQRFPALTPNEERLCAYLRINLNTKEISNMLNVTTAAVDKSRNRLRKKLEIGPEINLTEFIAGV